MPPRLLLIEDEPGIARPMQQALQAEGLEVVHAASAAEGLRQLAGGGFELLLLDLNLPDRSGWDVLDAVRRHHPGLLVLMATARDGLHDRLRGLREGADDYLPKPFVLAELVARVQALLRRSRALPQAQLALAGLRVDVLRREVWCDERLLELTAREFDVLHLLLRHAGRTVGRDTLGREVWHQASRTTALDNLIDVHIAHLRRKLQAGGQARLLHTVRGVGFQLSEREP
jgi:DNA-binding response OmpR family regulator